MNERRFTKTMIAVFAITVAVYVAVRLWRLTSYGLFGDEIFSFQLASDTWGGLLHSAITDVVHPPLFYLLLKLWIGIGGNSLLWVKLFPVCFSLAALVLLVRFCRELKLQLSVINLTVWLMAVNEYLVNFSQELRMYSPLLFFTLLSMCLFARYYKSPPANRLLAALLIVNLLLIFTHYYGWFVVAIEWLFLLLQRDRKTQRFSIVCLTLGLCFSFWAYQVAQAAKAKGGLGINLDWNNPPSLIDALWYYVILQGSLTYRWQQPLKTIGAMMITAIFLFPLLLLIKRRFNAKLADLQSHQQLFFILPMIAALPVAISFIASQFLSHSVWGIRYLIIAAPAYLILISLAVFEVKPRWLKAAIIAFFVAWSGASGFILLQNREKLALNAMVARLVRAETSEQPKIHIYTNRNTIGYTMQFYLEEENAPRFEVIYVDDYSQINDDYCWIAFIKFKYEHQDTPQKFLEEKGYRISKIIQSETFTQSVVFFAARKETTVKP